MIELPSARSSWNLDAVSIIAVLGEHNIFLTSQNICLSRLCFLPRLIPAPQGLLSVRPKTLAFDDGVARGLYGLYSGNQRAYLAHFPMLLHNGAGEHLPPFTVRQLKVRSTNGRPIVEPRLLSPLNVVAIVSFFLTMGLVGWAVAIRDGVALIGILVMAFTTPVLCLGRKWTYVLPVRRGPISSMPRGDVIWRTPHGSFTLVECTEDIARMLYFAPQHPEYLVSSSTGQGLSGVVGGLTLVVSIVLFGNATWTMKAALLATYTALNIVYWTVTLCPPRWTWRFNLEVEETLHENRMFTTALWTAIRLSKKVQWVSESSAIPRTQAWEEWLRMAEEKANAEEHHWDAQGALTKLLQHSKS